jgi:uncharacterized membrane protein
LCGSCTFELRFFMAFDDKLSLLALCSVGVCLVSVFVAECQTSGLLFACVLFFLHSCSYRSPPSGAVVSTLLL